MLVQGTSNFLRFGISLKVLENQSFNQSINLSIDQSNNQTNNQAPVVQKVDNTWFVLSALICWIVIYLVDSVIQPLNNQGQMSRLYLSKNCIVVSKTIEKMNTNGSRTQWQLMLMLTCLDINHHNISGK